MSENLTRVASQEIPIISHFKKKNVVNVSARQVETSDVASLLGSQSARTSGERVAL